ncbi:hypothetical protein N802_03540 [Knoellia sinensis KCTC 19936]|uniref:HTH tetR-type domain-containing protein n=1 Tax=Knoellia sinensis KCTC 19936 TaxID=1385520 RepID=A0A0A0J418_9MICO|nr:TetR/AcrR family transcriptional regulator [Knoellia sinensis]KGN31449.1 hypothetical protein N802_03540 [Knoellia sinensis KCTC 19936]
MTVSSASPSLPAGADWAPAGLEARLVEAALTALETTSVDRLSMRSVASSVGVSHQAPYTHFRSRTRFLAAVAGSGLAGVVTEAEVAVERAGDDPIARLLALGDHYASFIERRPHLFDLAFGPVVAMRDHRVLQEAAIAYWSLLRGVVLACQPPGTPDGEVQNRCEIAASTVYGIARMGAHHKIPRVVPATPRELVNSALRTLHDGWHVIPGQAPRTPTPGPDHQADESRGLP